MSEQIFKLQPNRTIALRGFDNFGAAAAITNATSTGFTVSGVFRDMSDFAVAVVWDADNQAEHYSIRYLPDMDFTGQVLTFNMSSTGVQPIDSAKFSWIDWWLLDLVLDTGEPIKVPLWPHATLASGTFTPASATFTITAPGGCTVFDRLTLFIDDAYIDFIAAGGESAATVAAAIAYKINTFTNLSGDAWPTFETWSVAVMASVDGTGKLTLTNAQTGYCTTSGTAVTWEPPPGSGGSAYFVGLSAGQPFMLDGFSYTIASVTSATSLTLTSAPTGTTGGGTNVVYLAPKGGIDGNCVQPYWVVRPSNVALAIDHTSLPLTGGVSDYSGPNPLSWDISIDFSALGYTSIRQAVLTFAPALTTGTTYADTEWSATLSSWAVSDPSSTRELKVAGPGSVRVGSADVWCKYAGMGWSQVNADNYFHGFAMQTANPGDAVTVEYHCDSTHDLYIGLELFNDRGILSISLDRDTPTTLDPFLNVASSSSPVMGRRKVRSAVASGAHSLLITLTNTNHVAIAGWDTNSLGYNCLFDFVEAVVASDVPDSICGPYANVTAALDFDTDATYKMPPARLLWAMGKLGLNAQINEYLGVFWWAQRVAFGGVTSSAVVTFGGTWAAGDIANVEIGTFTMRKDVTTWDTSITIAQHFAYYINSASIEMFASADNAGNLTITVRSPSWGDTLSTSKTSTAGTISASGNLNVGTAPTWNIDPSVSPAINVAVRNWHADFYAQVATLGWGCSTAISMELVNPPEYPPGGRVYVARFPDGSEVQTATGFSSLISNHCALGASHVISLQSAVLLELAALQTAAGLPVYLQTGEFLWWYFSETANPNTGVPAAGGMAFYDQETAAAATTALGRALHTFLSQDDDPAVNGGADVAFLVARLKSHIDSLHSAVLTSYPSAKFELLFPRDVTNPYVYANPAYNYAQGGRLNAAVNFPSAYASDRGGGLDRLKMEALSWGSSYRNLDLAKAAIALPVQQSWQMAHMAYLVPIFNGGCPWVLEHLAAIDAGVPLIVLWAWDHIGLLSWPLPLPVHKPQVWTD